MTPEEAVTELLAQGAAKGTVIWLVEAVKATAKADETRRCVARVKIWSARQAGTSEAWLRSITKELSNDMLITGGLEVDE